MITIVCWQCGARKDVETDPPQFGIDLVSIAVSSGWIGSFDRYRARVLVFCCEDCRKKAITKNGTYRHYPKLDNAKQVKGEGK